MIINTGMLSVYTHHEKVFGNSRGIVWDRVMALFYHRDESYVKIRSFLGYNDRYRILEIMKGMVPHKYGR